MLKIKISLEELFVGFLVSTSILKMVDFSARLGPVKRAELKAWTLSQPFLKCEVQSSLCTEAVSSKLPTSCLLLWVSDLALSAHRGNLQTPCYLCSTSLDIL